MGRGNINIQSRLKSRCSWAALMIPIMLQVSGAADRLAYVDHAIFRYDETQNYLEVSFTGNGNALERVTTDARQTGSMVFYLTLADPQSGDVIMDDLYRLPFTFDADSGQATEYAKTGIRSLAIPVQDLHAQLIVFDEHNRSHADTISWDIPNIDFNSNISLSQIELCSNLRKGNDPESPFYKNTYEVTPHPSAIYGKDRPVLFFYAESYNLATTEPAGSSTRTIRIFNAAGEQVSEQSNERKAGGESRIELGTVNVSTLPTGNYTLVVLLSNVAGEQAARSKVFRIHNPEIPPAALAAAPANRWRMMALEDQSETELDLEFDKAYSIASRSERKGYRKLKSRAEKIDFLTQFWTGRDPNPETLLNEKRHEFLSRTAEIEKKYQTGLTPGWKTDRGRIYIIYGPPDEIERFAQQLTTRPYEIWTYEQIQGGVAFIFADRSGFSEYLLVHSTARNETYDPDWLSKIRSY